MKDAHDPREFRQWVTFAPDGTIAAVHEFAANVEQPRPELIETTHVYPADLSNVAVDSSLVTSFTEAHADKVQKEEVLRVAVEAVVAAHVKLKAALTEQARLAAERAVADLAAKETHAESS